MRPTGWMWPRPLGTAWSVALPQRSSGCRPTLEQRDRAGRNAGEASHPAPSAAGTKTPSVAHTCRCTWWLSAEPKRCRREAAPTRGRAAAGRWRHSSRLRQRQRAIVLSGLQVTVPADADTSANLHRQFPPVPSPTSTVRARQPDLRDEIRYCGPRATDRSSCCLRMTN